MTQITQNTHTPNADRKNWSDEFYAYTADRRLCVASITIRTSSSSFLLKLAHG